MSEFTENWMMIAFSVAVLFVLAWAVQQPPSGGTTVAEKADRLAACADAR